MNPDADICSWRALRVVNLRGKRAVSRPKTLAVLRYWRDHSEPPEGYIVQWPAGKKRVTMDGLGEE